MVTPKLLVQLYSRLEIAMRDKGYIPGKSGRHMKYPYTFTAKIVQFPIFFYLKNNWIWMYYPLGWIVGFYAFMKIHNVVNSDENKRSWAETQRKFAEKEAEAHH